jgi:hypothetical protein
MRRLPGRLEAGNYPVELVANVLCPEALKAIGSYMAPFDARAALAAACGELERVSAERIRNEQLRLVGLAGPWAAEHFARLDRREDDEVSRHARAATMLVEAVLANPPTGPASPDRQDVARLMGFCAWAIDLAVQNQQAYVGLAPAHITVSEVGDVEAVVYEPMIDLFGWQQARWAYAQRGRQGAASAYEPPGRPSGASSEPNAFEPITEVLIRLADACGPDAPRARALTLYWPCWRWPSTGRCQPSRPRRSVLRRAGTWSRP